jgi:tRNA threonylcarbamoyladenosine biosynthesis protein TsaE
MNKLKIKSNSMESTVEAGEQFAKGLSSGDVVVLTGGLGSGKTTFTKGIAKGLGVKEWRKVASPTFVIMNSYRGKKTLYHFDFYRLNRVSEISDTGFHELVNGDGISVVEWGEKFKDIFPERTKWLTFKYVNERERLIIIKV